MQRFTFAGLACLPALVQGSPPTFDVEVYYDVTPGGMTPEGIVAGALTEAIWEPGVASVIGADGEVESFDDLDAAYSYFQHITTDGRAFGIGWAEGVDPFISWSPSEGFMNLGAFPGTIHGEIEDCNDAHQVITWAENESIESEPTHGYVWQDGVWTNLGSLRADPEAWTSVFPRAINEAGVIVGSSVTDVVRDGGGLATHAFRWTPETGMIDLGSAAGETGNSVAHDVNASGMIVGSSQAPGAVFQRAAIWTPEGEIVVIGPAGYSSHAQLVTDTGVVFGSLNDVDLGHRAFRWTAEDGFEVLEAIGLAFHEFRDANSSGVAVGVALTQHYALDAVVYLPETGLVSLNELITHDEAGFIGVAQTVTEAGVILAGGQVETGPNQFQTQTLVLTPACAADMNGDGSLDVLDFVAFQGAFVEGDEGADCNGDGALTVLDFVCFQSLFGAGCP